MGLFSASGVALSSILTTSALLTAVVAFARQDTLGDVVAVRLDKESFREVLARDPRVVDEIGRQTALEADAAASAHPVEQAIEHRSRALVRAIRGFFRLQPPLRASATRNT